MFLMHGINVDREAIDRLTLLKSIVILINMGRFRQMEYATLVV